MNRRPARGFLYALLAVVLAAALCSAFFFQLLLIHGDSMAPAYRSGSLVLQIRDPLIGENDGCFALRFAEGKAVSVEKCGAPPDAALEISAFSALIAGVCDFSEARRWMPGLQILREEAPLERLFYRKPLMIPDYF